LSFVPFRTASSLEGDFDALLVKYLEKEAISAEALWYYFHRVYLCSVRETLELLLMKLGSARKFFSFIYRIRGFEVYTCCHMLCNISDYIINLCGY